MGIGDLVTEGKKAYDDLARIVENVGPKMGLSGGDQVRLVKEIGMNGQVRGIVLGMGGGAGANGATDPRYDAFYKAMGDRFKGDKDFVDNLNTDLEKNPGLAKKLVAAIESNPDQAARMVKDYKYGQLNTSVTELETRIAATSAKAPPKVDPAPATEARKPAVQQKAETAASPTPSPKAPSVKRRADPSADATAPARGEPIAFAATSTISQTSLETVATAAVRPAEKISGEEVVRRAKEETIRDLATGSDEHISKLFTTKGKDGVVPAMAAAVADFGANKFPNDSQIKQESRNFLQKIDANPQLREDIAKNLAKNPGLVRTLTKAMSEDEPSNAAMDGQMRNLLLEVYQKPEKLADDKWTSGLQTKMAMGGVMDWVKTNLGIDLQGMLSGVGQMLQGVFKQIAGFFKQFSGGNFAQISNLNPNASFFDKIGRAWDQSQDFEKREPALRNLAQPLHRPGVVGGPVSDGIQRDAEGNPLKIKETRIGADGEKVTVEKNDYRPDRDDRVTITTYGGNTAKVYLTDGLNATREPNGNYSWRFATDLEAKSGAVDRVSQYTLTEAESRRLYRMTAEAAQASGRSLRMEDPFKTPIMTPEVQHYRSMDKYNAQAKPIVETFPLQTPEVPKPQNDPDLAFKMGTPSAG